MFSGVQGYWDGFYITLWLDGLNGGSISTEVRSMRNFDFMLSGAWLSLLPTVALILGAIAILGKPATSARNGQLFALLCAGIYMLAVAKLSLVNPNYCSFKAGYTLGVLPCYAVIGAQGFRYLTKNEYARAATIALMACWAMSVFVAYLM